MSESSEPEQFGCAACRAVPASRSEFRLTRVRNLFEDPHDGYALFACPECGQPFLEQFQEITWLPNGEDDIWLLWMPLTEQEHAEINQLCPDVTEDGNVARRFAEMMRTRGRLVRDPNGVFAWYDTPRDAGNLFGP